MKILKKNKIVKNLVITALILLSVYLLGQMEYFYVHVGKVLTIIIIPSIFSGFFYYLLRPFVRFLDKKNVHRNISVIVVLIGVVLIIGLTMILSGSMIVEEFGKFISNFMDQLDTLQIKAEELLNSDSIFGKYSVNDIVERLIAYFEGGNFSIGELTSGWYSNVSELFTIVILIPVIVFFLLKDDRFFYDNLIKFVPEKQRGRVRVISREIDKILSIYFVSQLILAVILGIMTYIGYLLIGLPNALSLALILMFLSVIPFIGPIVAVIPAALIALTTGYEMVLKLLFVIIITQTIDGNLVRPKVMGDRLNIHPLIVIILVIVGISLFGFIGAFFAIPFYGIVRVVFKNIYQPKSQL